ncbi:BAH_G0032520.mRNA.1.CDS.1 [Saccharomyces cerevisiae]|nr:SX2_G0004580.mRNA.1.CDS.1 [Saccharomyces cerevisiae]CAI4568998.1 BAH_G0032520.mRNA.1.CDS.1 [Saccharomyces cerevisiae]CAI4572302.1 BAG_1a_G0032610.mRNA.1.CDS.1 [Saccharomyces cerevisiae]CAI7184680.1 BAG_1a_G0032610.mRNA.1.CDS.1 [Saccharomyces cerevisiae]CAI7185846.1 BAH_G0032520.mRNA.1.CDS.1 [Saccharomyces cerevisiae]
MTAATTSQPAFSPDQVSVIFVLGGPGAGKGTQCEKLVKDYSFVHLSAGDLLRAEQGRAGSQYGELIKNCIKEGQIVPQEITLALLRNAISDNIKANKHKFLIDGFPRKMDQAISFERDIVESKFILFFDCPEDIMLERLLERGKTSGRSDDNIESIKKRFNTFKETSMPVIEYFETKSKVVRVRCDKSVEDVYKDVQDAIRDRL